MNKFIKVIMSLCVIFAVFISMPVLNVSAEETTEKTDYYQLIKISEKTYRADIYGDADLNVLKKSNVTSVRFFDCNFDSLKDIPNNFRLTTMRFNNCELNSLNGIERFVSLTTLDFNDSVVKDISKVSKAKRLTSLGLSHINAKEYLSVMEKLDELTTLNFNYCDFEELYAIPYFKNLKQLEFFYCNMESINGIERFTGLEKLYFSIVGIENISNIKELVNLTDLALENTNVKYLTAIESLTKLKTLDIDDCLRIESLDSLRKLENLEILWAKNCQMALNEETFEHLKKIGTKTDFTKEDLQLKEKITDIYYTLNLEGKAEREKIDIITQYVVDTIEYDFEVSKEWREHGNIKRLKEYNDNALKYALNGRGCCRNYSALLTVLLLKADVDVYEVWNDEHIWNMVKSNSEYYWIDTIRVDEISKGNLAESPDYMTQDEKFFELHKALSLPSNYYAKTSEPITESTPNEIVTKSFNSAWLTVAFIILIAVATVIVNRKKK